MQALVASHHFTGLKSRCGKVWPPWLVAGCGQMGAEVASAHEDTPGLEGKPCLLVIPCRCEIPG